MATLREKLIEYRAGGYGGPSGVLDKSDMSVLKSKHSKIFKKPLYRAEESEFTLNKNKLKVGSKFSFDGDLRSFSSDKEIMRDWYDLTEDMVVFKTKGTVKSIDYIENFDLDNPREFGTSMYLNQSELLTGGTFEVESIERKSYGRMYGGNSDMMVTEVTIKQTSFEPLPTRGAGGTSTSNT